MSPKRLLPDRRRVLRGIGGVVLGLPALDVFEGRAFARRKDTRKIYCAFMLQQNGAVQGMGADPDMFWPRAFGAIDANAMATTDADRATSELKDHASKLGFVRGLDFHYSSNHAGGPIAASTGAPVVGEDISVLPVGPSADVFIADQLTPGREPLALYAGAKGTFRDDAFSFSKGGTLRIADNNPWNVYQRITGLSGVDPAMRAQIAARRTSVNDLVRADLQNLLARRDLSKADRDRIDLHLSSVRDLEIGMSAVNGPTLDASALLAVNGTHTADENMEQVVALQLDLIAFSFASDRVRTASLQIGGCNDHTRYTIQGVQAPPYHYISHRAMSDGRGGEPIPDAISLHHEIDRIHARFFKHLLDRLAAYTLPEGGSLLDGSVNLWVNSLSDGPSHGGKNVPHVLAGSAGGFLKTGLYLTASGYTSRMLNTLISAAGVRKPAGDLIDDFNDPMGTGVLTELVA
jgi:Protein of unknown function (DUF1552)